MDNPKYPPAISTASAVWNYLGLGQGTRDKVPTTQRALPASWYRSENLYQLERRAIFSRRWLLVSHKLRFPNPGDWVRFELAGFPVIICRDKAGNINGFHNVCRHRAFPVVTEEKGSSQIFACKYHGWSYGLSGKLAKAPGYQDMPDFEKSANGLLPVHVHIDTNGYIWVNLDSSQEAEVPWSEDFHGVDTQERFKDFNFEDYRFDHTWGMTGNYNWKTLADNYNECYHCACAHPDVASLANLNTYSVDTAAGHIQHFPDQSARQKEESGIKFCSTFYFPYACMTVSNNFMYMMRCVPTSPTQCSMEYEVYRHKDATDEGFQHVDAMFKRILGEDKWLCDNAQKNLNAGVFVNGELHPRMEKGPLFFQSTVRKILQEHRRREEALQQEIWPARQVLPPNVMASESEQDVAFCNRLDCQTEAEW